MRVKLLVFLLETFGTFSLDDGDSLSNDFLHDFVSTITTEVRKLYRAINLYACVVMNVSLLSDIEDVWKYSKVLHQLSYSSS